MDGYLGLRHNEIACFCHNPEKYEGTKTNWIIEIAFGSLYETFNFMKTLFIRHRNPRLLSRKEFIRVNFLLKSDRGGIERDGISIKISAIFDVF